MPRRTTKAALKLIERFDNALAHYEEMLKSKTCYNLHFQTEFVKTHSVDYFEGWISGVQAMVDQCLMDSNCYHGFYYVDRFGAALNIPAGKHIQDHHDYKPFRIKYYIKA